MVGFEALMVAIKSGEGGATGGLNECSMIISELGTGEGTLVIRHDG